MAAIACRLVRWVADDPQPGIVEAELTDVDGRRWAFIDKVAVFTSATVSSATAFPVDGIIHCQVVGRNASDVIVSTATPDGVESDRTTFTVASSALR